MTAAPPDRWCARDRRQGTYTLLVEKTDTVQALFDQLKGKVSLRGDSNKKLKTSSEPVSPAAPPVAAPPAGDRMDVSPQPAPHNGVPAKPGALARVAQDDNAMATSEDEHSPPAVVAAVPTAPMDEDLEDEVRRRATRHGVDARGNARADHGPHARWMAAPVAPPPAAGNRAVPAVPSVQRQARRPVRRQQARHAALDQRHLCRRGLGGARALLLPSQRCGRAC